MALSRFKYQEDIKNWFNQGVESQYILDNFCENRFIFNSRLDSFEKKLKVSIPDNCRYLILASLGEIGNNCFDHNLGHWQDKSGCLFIRESDFCLIADRGRGIESSLSQVVEVENKKYVDYAYTHIISGRAPERRGNGLKFVKKSTEVCKTSIFTISGSEIFTIGANPKILSGLKNSGVLTVMSW